MGSGLFSQNTGVAKEYLADPLLTVAAFMLIAVSVLWILFSRLISYNLKSHARKIRKFQDQIRSGMTIEEIKTAEARRRHMVRRKR